MSKLHEPKEPAAKRVLLFFDRILPPALLVCTICLLLSACRAAPTVHAAAYTPAPTATPSPTPTPTPEPTPSPTPTPVPTPDGLCGGRYDVFTEGETIETEDAYRSGRVALFFEQRAWAAADSPTGQRLCINICQVYVQDIESLQAVQCKYAHLQSVAKQADAVFAVSGDYYSWRKEGLALRNGELLRGSVDWRWDVCVLYRDGRMESFERGHYGAGLAQNPDIWHIFSFGPALLDEAGRALAAFHAEGQHKNGAPYTTNPAHYGARTARIALGYYEPGHYVFVNVEYPGKRSAGMRMDELAQFMESLGCAKAYNLDGGQTARMWFGNELKCEKGAPARPLMDAIVICR